MKKHTMFKILLIFLMSSQLLACSYADIQNLMTISSVDEIDVESFLEEDDVIEEVVITPNEPQPINSIEDKSTNDDSDPEYAIVFPQDEVNEILIRIDPEDWQTMQEDMTALYGEFGTRSQEMEAGQPPMQNMRDNNQPAPINQGEKGGQRPPVNQGVEGGQRPAMEGGQMINMDENPVWVPAEIIFEGESWEFVGIRYKGNSSLRGSWTSGINKIPFKLDFDQFEDDYPETEDQRFYGFKQISFSSGFGDSSMMREKIMADLFRENGVAAAQTAYYKVYVDYGEGEIYYGLYTAVELVDDTVIETQFESDEGNVYKPDGTGATFAAGSFNEKSFDKETNQDENDYSDILALYDALHANNRLTDSAAWRQNLESVFDVDIFLNWLAINTTAQNWDTYGTMSHNYYLYNDPDTGLLTWIPWDNNEALDTSNMKREPLSFSMDEVGNDWPLIRYLLDDEVYYEQYLGYIEAFIQNTFNPEEMVERYEETYAMIAPYVIGAEGEQQGYTHLRSEQEFTNQLQYLIQHVNTRVNEATNFLQIQ